MNVLSTLKSAQLSSGDGQLNLQPILEAQKNIATANQSLQQQVQKYQQLPKAHIGMVKNAYATGNTQLTKMADKVNQLSGTFQILPDFLGSDQPRTYAFDGYDHFGGAFVRWPDWFCGCGNYRQRQDRYR